MQIRRRNADIGVSGGVANFGKRSPTGKGVADKRMAAVVDGERFESLVVNPFHRPLSW